MKSKLNMALLLSLVFIWGCPYFTSIKQPARALPEEIIQIPIEIFTDDNSYNGFFGIFMPIGWKVSGDTILVNNGYEIYYDSTNTTLMNSVGNDNIVGYFNWENKENYRWWAGQYTNGGESFDTIKALIPI